MNSTAWHNLRLWLVGTIVVALIVAASLGLGLYLGRKGWTTPTVPPWPEPKPTPVKSILGPNTAAHYTLTLQPSERTHARLPL